MAPLAPRLLPGIALLLAAAPLAPLGAATCNYTEYTHTYGFGTAGGVDSTLLAARTEAGTVQVFDSNLQDCNGDGRPGDFDGDYESGVGGAFFGYGIWEGDLDCKYGLDGHGPNVWVNDAIFLAGITFVIGAMDTDGPVKGPDPVTGETVCTTDGAITPGLDPDDCLSPIFIGTGQTCGMGGDGGYWVILLFPHWMDGQGGIAISNPPTFGTITTQPPL